MGAKHSFRSLAGGGCPFFYAPFHHSEGASVLPAFILSGRQFSDNRGKKGQKLDFICLRLCFLGKIGDKKGQNLRYI